MGSPRILRDSTVKARVTRLGPDLVLVSVPIRRADDVPALRVLTRAERAVIDLARRGLSNAEIARRRRCSARTIANQLAAAYAKLGIRGRRELFARYSK